VVLHRAAAIGHVHLRLLRQLHQPGPATGRLHRAVRPEQPALEHQRVGRTSQPHDEWIEGRRYLSPDVLARACTTITVSDTQADAQTSIGELEAAA
jgi:hypothetical protein